MDYQYYMKMALKEANSALLKGEFPVGCVIVQENQIIAKGSRVRSSGPCTNEIDHAEMVVLRQLAEIEQSREKKQMTIFSTMEPCLMCLGAIILSGISKIVYAYEDVMGGSTTCDLKKLNPLYKDAQITIIPNILRSESLALFKDFFSNPHNDYWRESILSKYTRDQPIP